MTDEYVKTPVLRRDLLGALRHLRLAWRLWRDRRVPVWPKLVPLAALAYVLVPMDLVVDPILGLGQMDDLAIIVLGLKLFVGLCPAALVAQHRRELAADPVVLESARGEVVDASYRVLDEREQA